jgi:twitching motility two-component system response regulator PilH
MSGRLMENHEDRRRPRTVLVVDDSTELLTAVQLSLESNGFRVLQASNPFAGVRLAANHEPDAIVMDLDMPGMDGVEATRHLKRIHQTRSIPVIAFTSRVPLTERLEARGFSRIIGKSSGLEHLESELEDVLRPGNDGDRRHPFSARASQPAAPAGELRESHPQPGATNSHPV